MLPQGDASIGLHVRNEDLEVALAIVKELDKRNNEKPDISFRDADKEDIYYEKEVNEKENQLLNTDFIFTWTSILLFILILGILAAGISGWSIF